MADNMVTDPGTNSTRMMTSTIPENTTPAPGKTLQRCICGWEKVTSTAGLKIHQGKKKCLKEVEQGSRIDHYFLRNKSSQSSEVQWQDVKHSPQNINPPVPKEEEASTAEHHEPSQHLHPTETKIQKRRPPINWPKSSEKKVWETVNTDLILQLEQLRGTAVKKLERLGDSIYSYRAEREVAEKRSSRPSIPTQSRRQQEMTHLVKGRRQLKKQWRLQKRRRRV